MDYIGGPETLWQMPCVNGLLFVKGKCTFLAASYVEFHVRLNSACSCEEYVLTYLSFVRG